MISPDIVNGLFGLAAAAFLLPTLRAVRRDRTAMGVSVFTPLFFATLGVWNVLYFAHLEQPFSSAGNFLPACMNIAWFGHLLAYRKNKAPV